MRLQVGLVICALFLPGVALAQMSTKATFALVVIEPIGITGPAQLSTSETRRPDRMGSWSATGSDERTGGDQRVVSVDSSDTLSARHDDGILVVARRQGQAARSPMQLGSPVAPPAGYIEFCHREPSLCGVDRSAVNAAMLGLDAIRAATLASALRARFPSGAVASDAPLSGLATPAGGLSIQLNPRLWSHLIMANEAVNRALRPADDAVTYGAADVWALPLRDGRRTADCEDYVLEKQRALVAAGVSGDALSIAVVRTSLGQAHAVLLVETRQGLLVLDNLTSTIRGWREARYIWIMRQAPGRPLDWRTIENDPLA